MSSVPLPLQRLQDRILGRIGTSPDDRGEIIAAMLARGPVEVTAYWLQLFVALGIATLGLVLGSTAVVIAAMLVAPLMGPIVGLAMGLATGGPLLTLRATTRVAVSVVVVVAGSAGVTALVPFHEMTSELAARTVPTALDLITAAFCALAGVYATARVQSDTATTAAGTSIGISLVPPLCTAGFCFATAQWSLGFGAVLLFLTNMVAIVLVGTIAFVGLGFNQVRVASLESEYLARETGEVVVRGVARVLADVFASPWGRWMRLLMPVALLAIVYVPLRRALDEVTWQVEVRRGARQALAEIEAEVVTSQLRVERHQVEASLVVIGARADAERIRGELEDELRRIAGVVPRVQVRAVPDAAAAAAEVERLPTNLAVPVAPPAPQPFAERLADVHDDLRAAIGARWPYDGAGEPLAIDVDAQAAELRVVVTYVGMPIDAVAREVLERALADELDLAISIEGRALPSSPQPPPHTPEALARLSGAIEHSRAFERVQLCVRDPALLTAAATAPGDGAAAPGDTGAPVMPTSTSVVDALVSTHPRAQRIADATWSVRFALDECVPVE